MIVKEYPVKPTFLFQLLSLSSSSSVVFCAVVNKSDSGKSDLSYQLKYQEQECQTSRKEEGAASRRQSNIKEETFEMLFEAEEKNFLSSLIQSQVRVK